MYRILFYYDLMDWLIDWFIYLLIDWCIILNHLHSSFFLLFLNFFERKRNTIKVIFMHINLIIYMKTFQIILINNEISTCRNKNFQSRSLRCPFVALAHQVVLNTCDAQSRVLCPMSYVLSSSPSRWSRVLNFFCL